MDNFEKKSLLKINRLIVTSRM